MRNGHNNSVLLIEDNQGDADLVRLRLIFAKGDRRRWPDLIAAPRLRRQQ